MSNFTFTLPLGGYSREWEGLSLKERGASEMISLAVANDEISAFTKTFKVEFGKAPPKPSEMILIPNGWVMWSGRDQYLISLSGPNINIDREIAAKFSTSAYATLQTDAWVSLELVGLRAYDVLERFIALDLRNASKHYAARTSAHHMAVIVMKFSDTEFRLMSPRSSANAFSQALIHTIDAVLGEV